LGLAGPAGRFGEPVAVDRVVDLYGPTDFNALLGASARIRHGHPKAPEVQLIGGRIEEHPEAVAAANPISYVTAAAPPFLILQGDRDDFVPSTQSYLLHHALLQAGAASRLHLLEGVGHGGPAFRTPAVRGLIRNFLAQTPEPAQRENGAG
jgi:acetyl esterase/lipase